MANIAWKVRATYISTDAEYRELNVEYTMWRVNASEVIKNLLNTQHSVTKLSSATSHV